MVRSSSRSPHPFTGAHIFHRGIFWSTDYSFSLSSSFRDQTIENHGRSTTESPLSSSEGTPDPLLSIFPEFGRCKVRPQFQTSCSTTTRHLTGLTSLVGRQFIKIAYPAVKSANPDLPILIREAAGTPARAFARFGKTFGSSFAGFRILPFQSDLD